MHVTLSCSATPQCLSHCLSHYCSDPVLIYSNKGRLQTLIYNREWDLDIVSVY